MPSNTQPDDQNQAQVNPGAASQGGPARPITQQSQPVSQDQPQAATQQINPQPVQEDIQTQSIQQPQPGIQQQVEPQSTSVSVPVGSVQKEAGPYFSNSSLELGNVSLEHSEPEPNISQELKELGIETVSEKHPPVAEALTPKEPQQSTDTTAFLGKPAQSNPFANPVKDPAEAQSIVAKVKDITRSILWQAKLVLRQWKMKKLREGSVV